MAWTVVLGPGERFEGLAELLGALGRALGSTGDLRVVRLDDLALLLEGHGSSGVLLLDEGEMPLEDLGLVRRFLARNPRWSLFLCGADPGRPAARAALELEGAGWIAWPPDLDQLRDLVRPRGPGAGVAPAAKADAPPPPPTPEPPPVEAAEPGEAAEPAEAAEPPREAPAPEPEELPPVLLPRPVARAPAAAALEGSAPAGDLSRLRQQVAALADIAQRIELCVDALRESGRAPLGELDILGLEVGRLLRFTRTLSTWISPPARGGEEFDLGPLLEEQMASLTLRGQRGPRFLARIDGELVVFADRAALTDALEALLRFARSCAGPGEIVRVRASPRSAGSLAIAIEFPEGPLAGMSAREVADPSLLRERLPELGPGELDAAEALLRSQGGSLAVERFSEEGLAFDVRLPLSGAGAALPLAPTGAGGGEPSA